MTSTRQTSRSRLRVLDIALALAMVIVAAIVTTRPAQAQTFGVLYTFTGGTDGAYPYAGLVRDKAGNLYGTTYQGGSAGCGGCGVVFRVDKTDTETVLYTFTGGNDGANPYAGVIRDSAGNLYGATEGGGAYGGGVVFKLDTSNTETPLYSFCPTGNCPDGAIPDGNLIRDKAGNLYGTAVYGGAYGFVGGVVYKVDTTDTETVLHSFAGYPTDGAYPETALVQDAAGNLYGTTAFGGSHGGGVIFKVDTSDNETLLHNFTWGKDGSESYANLIQDAAGNLYGSTVLGGSGGCSGYGCGVLFKLSKTGKYTVLYTFTGGADGADPGGTLVRDTTGNLYGVTGTGADGWGTVFKLHKTGKLSVLHTFTGGSDGAGPNWVIRDAAGNLYGTATYGGSGSGLSGYGTVFKIAP